MDRTLPDLRVEEPSGDARIQLLSTILHWLPIVTTLLICAIFAAANVVLVSQMTHFDDLGAYFGAAHRLIDGQPLYVTPAIEADKYRYAPWFAFAWMPLTLLPSSVVTIAWVSALAVATLIVLWPLRDSLAGWALILLLGGLLYRTDGWGNVQALVVLALFWALPRRSGPWVLGITASLKVLPLFIFVPVYLWRHQWRAAMIAVGVAIALWAPALLFDLSNYPPARPPNVYDSTLLLALPGMFSRAELPRTPASSR